MVARFHGMQYIGGLSQTRQEIFPPKILTGKLIKFLTLKLHIKPVNSYIKGVVLF